MILLDGRGYLIRAGRDTPYAGWAGTRVLEGLAPTPALAPWMALRALNLLLDRLPGGFALAWDSDPSWFPALSPEQRMGFWEALTALPGLTLHVLAEGAMQLPLGAFRGWLHAETAPTGALGERWRQGVVGWVPDSPKQWSLVGLGRVPHGETALLGASDEVIPGHLWGEVILPVGALGTLDGDDLASRLEGAQRDLERSLAQRLQAGAWPEALPFQRRRTSWRLALLGGSEFQRANGDWDQAAGQVEALTQALAKRLRTTVQVGCCMDREAGETLGRQAMREALPWRNSLPLPPASPRFSPGLGADPFQPSPLEARAALPAALRPLLQEPPAALLRVPGLPSEGAALSFLAGLGQTPALRWCPPDIQLDIPFDPEEAPALLESFPYPQDPGSGQQISLFDLE
jgi:hypothetical protein